MSESLSSRISITLAASLQNTLALTTPTEELSAIIQSIFTDGTGANQANRLFSVQRTLAASNSQAEDLFSFGGSKDSLGRTYAVTAVKLLLLQNLSANGGDILQCGGGPGGGDNWTSPFGTDTDLIKVRGGGTLLLIAPDATGYVVTSGVSNFTFFINNVSANSITYNLYVLGEQ